MMPTRTISLSNTAARFVDRGLSTARIGPPTLLITRLVRIESGLQCQRVPAHGDLEPRRRHQPFQAENFSA